MRTGARRAAKTLALQLLRFGAPGRTPALLGYPVQPRGRGANDAIGDLFDAHRDHFVSYLQSLPDVPAATSDATWIPERDARLLARVAAKLQPRIYMEIGAGASTAIVAAASPASRIVAIDPEPRLPLPASCEHIACRLEDVDLSIFDQLQAGDLLFCDGSHFALPGSDATVFVLEVLPRLAAGVTVGIHDIFLPEDYPDDMVSEWAGEQHLVAAWLIGGGIDQVVLPAAYLDAGQILWLETSGK